MGSYSKEGTYIIMFSLKRTKECSSFSWEVYGLKQERGGNETKIERRGDAHIQELCIHMHKEFTGSDSTEKKLFSFTDSDVVEA